MSPASPPSPLVAEIHREVTALSARFRSSPQSWLHRPLRPRGDRARAGRALAQRFADAARGIEQRDARQAPGWPRVPDLGVFAVGDQLAVTGGDLVAAAGQAPADAEVWTPHGRAALAHVLTETAAACREIRSRL